MINVVVCGAAGRMGNRLIHLIQNDPKTNLVGAVEAPSFARMGIDAGTLAGLGAMGVKVLPMADLSAEIDAVIDFSSPSGAAECISYCQKNNLPLVMATTGLEGSAINALHLAAKSIPIVWAPNMSLAVNLSMKLVEMAAQVLKNDHVDVEIIEKHHRNKADSPSGTALKFGEIIARQMSQSEHRHGRYGMVGQRPQNEIGYHAVRAGDNPGEHTILFGMPGETIELRVAASNRDCYALGAISAAKFAVTQSPGLYSMMNVLGLEG
jgi:4-hydroxy-tetrahydrodipicolinate reductase